MLYAEPYQHDRWTDHVERVQWTSRILNKFVEEWKIHTAVDPACGDGAILNSLPYQVEKCFGDYVSAPHVDVQGPLEDTLPLLAMPAEQRPYTVLVLTEIIEHVADPVAVLKLARQHFDWMLLTTPIDEDKTIHDNPQHIWSWGIDDMATLLHEAGWHGNVRDRLDTFWYDYQLWICG